MASGQPSKPLAPNALRRYLPPDLAEAIERQPAESAMASYTLEAFVHLAAARYSLSTYLPRLLLRQILDAGQHSPWLQWAEGTLLFADLSGSTALAERLAQQGREGTEQVTDALNHVFSTMIAVIESYGGDLLTFGGDALLVFFGDERHPRTAARAALALQHALDGYEHTVPGVGSFPMHLHIGLESGPIALVSAGLEHDRHCFAMGATVNRVAAAEAAAGPGHVVAGPQATIGLAGYATGAQIAPDFFQLASMRPPRKPHAPLPDQPPITLAPEQAIPQILDELSRISPYVPPVLLEKILADPQRPLVEAELRPVTVLFAQVIGLETLVEQLPPAEAAEALQQYIATMQEAIELFGGVVNKLDIADQGLKLVAIFGAPIAYEDHTERAALAALEMQERFAQTVEGGGWTEITQSSTLPPPPSIVQLQQRVGLNLGTAFAGNVGSASRKEYTVIGDAVNVAARVMSHAAWGAILCSAAVSSGIQARLLCEPRGSVALKGKAQPLAVFQVSARRELPRNETPVFGPLIGRERERGWLREHLHASAKGHGRAIRLVGEAGVGKSRLLAALVEEARTAGFNIVAATCFSYTSGIPYAAWSEWLRAYCDIRAGDSDAQRIQKLATALQALGPDMEEWLPVLGDLARLDVPENRLTRGLDPKLRQERRFELLERLLLHAATQQPVLVLFEDLHWADPISLELWQRIAAKLEGHAVLLGGAHRPNLAPPHEHTHVLRLGELSAEESSIMVSALGGDDPLPEPVLRQIVARAAGNPLFLHELILAVQEKLQLAEFKRQDNSKRDTQSTLANLQSAIEELPDSLNGLLLARIDQLDETSRMVLRVASVIGQRIPFGVLRALQPHDQEMLIRQLLRLDEHELTQLERLEPERVHTFRHALIQEVAYQSMLYARRRELHGRIGAYLERRYAGDLDDYVGLIAHHYRLSDRREKAIDYLLLAGHAASAVYANEEAIQSFQWALDALHDNDDQRAWIARDALGDVFATIGRYDDALAQHNAVLAASSHSNEAARKAHAKRGAVLEKQGQYAAALEELDQAMQIAESAEGISPLAVPAICADVGLVYQRRGEYDQAIAACERGLATLDRDPRTRDDEQIEARLQLTLGTVYGMRGDYNRARQHFEHSLKIRELIDDLPGLAGVHNNLGYLWQLQNEYAQALAQYELAEQAARQINLRLMLVFAIGNACYAQICLGDYAGAEQKCREVLQLAQEIHAQNNVAQAHNMLGLIFYYRGRYSQALAEFERALAMHQQLESKPQVASTLANIAIAYVAAGNRDGALAYAEQALQQANDLQIQRIRADALIALAEAQLLIGETTHAHNTTAELLALTQTGENKLLQGIAERLRGQVASTSQEDFAAAFTHSVALLQASKDLFELGRTYAAYGVALVERNRADLAHAYLKQAQDTFISIEAQGELQKLQPFIERNL